MLLRNSFLIKFLNFLILILIVIMMIVVITLPFLVDQYVKFWGIEALNVFALKVFLCLTAIPFIVLLLKAKKLCNNIIRCNPFCQGSVEALNVISISAFIDFLLYAIGTFVIFKNLLALTLMIAAFMVGLVSLILAQLVKLAIEIKQENDLTI